AAPARRARPEPGAAAVSARPGCQPGGGRVADVGAVARDRAGSRGGRARGAGRRRAPRAGGQLRQLPGGGQARSRATGRAGGRSRGHGGGAVPRRGRARPGRPGPAGGAPLEPVGPDRCTGGMTRRLLFALIAAAAAVLVGAGLAGPASAGGWAITTLDPLA